MARFLVRRTGTALLVIFATSVLVFLGVRAIPGDPVTVMAGQQQSNGESLPNKRMIAYIRHKYDLGKPLPVQYGDWIWLLLHGDFGRDQHEQPIGQQLATRLPITLELAALAMLVAAAVGIPLGVITAMRRGKPTDHVTNGIAVVAMSIPGLWLAFLLITWFAIDLRWLPAGGYRSIRHPLANLEHMVLPVVVVAYAMAAHLIRQTRTSMLDTLGSEYIRTARAKGLREKAVVGRHALRNSLLTVVTVFGLMLGGLLVGAAIAESIFGIPGYASLLVSSVGNRDYPVVQATVLIAAVAYVITSLLADIAYALLNPKIRVS
jgi:peptide/nickel transport system permease protein